MNQPQTLQEVERLLGEETDARYLAFSKLSLSLAFGGLMFLLVVEKDYTAPPRHHLALVQWAWFLMLGSCLAGYALQVCLAAAPSHRIRGARLVLPPAGSGQAPRVTIPGKLSIWERVWFHAHVALFLSSVAFLGAFKAMNYDPAA